MKKLTAFGLSAAMMMSMSSMVFAEETTMGTGDQEIDVHAKYEDNTSSSAVYSVDVSWGAMEFTYTEDGTLTWTEISSQDSSLMIRIGTSIRSIISLRA